MFYGEAWGVGSHMHMSCCGSQDATWSSASLSARGGLSSPHPWLHAEFPKLVKHVDESFLAQVTELYRQRIPEGGIEC